jgi:hypothetical protein
MNLRMLAKKLLKDISWGIGIGLVLAAPIGLINAHEKRSKAPARQEKAKPSRMHKRTRDGLLYVAAPIRVPVRLGIPSASA